MACWKDYLNVKEKKGDVAAWSFAQKKFPKNSLDYMAAKRFHAPNSKDRQESVRRQISISNVSHREIVENCQFESLFR